jgi:hypothetical protein
MLTVPPLDVLGPTRERDMRHRVKPHRLVAGVVLAVCVAAAGGLTRVPAGEAAVAASAQPGECPPVMPVAEVTRGMTGTALSVVQGTEPASFNAEVLGVLPDGIAPGRDLIVVNLSGAVIDQTGGLWFGASGSPVYVFDPVDQREELVGAIAYGLSFGESTLAGLTPAEDMVGLLDPTTPVALEQAAAERIRVPDGLARRMAASADVSVAEAASFERLRVPLSVSGLTPRGLQQVRAAIARQDLPFVPYMGSAAAPSATSAVAALSAGDSFVAAESLGDVTFAGVGTTTFVCYGQAVAFGHPFAWTGETTLAARAADTVTIVRDPFGSYKLATIGDNAGIVTEDRLAGIAADLGEGPATTPITTDVTDLDTGRTRHGETHVVMPEATPFLAFVHTFTNIDVTIDRIGPGNSEIAFAITGTRDGGRTWRFARTNHYASPFDISFGSIDELSFAAEILQGFQGEDIEITGIDVSRLDVEKSFESYRLTKVVVWNGRRFVQRDVVRARPGQRVFLRAVLAPSHRRGTATVDFALRVPEGARRDGFIEVRGGNAGGFDLGFVEEVCFFEDGSECGAEAGPQSFDKLLTSLRSEPRNDVLTARLRLGPSGATRAVGRTQMDAVVSGARFIGFRLIR